MIKNNKGITIIALIITVIVLIIIAGVTIEISTDRDIIGSAGEAKQKYEDAAVKQILDSIYLSEKNKYNSGLISEDVMWINIENNIEADSRVNFGTDDIPSGGINVKVDDELKYKITLDNGVEVIE